MTCCEVLVDHPRSVAYLQHRSAAFGTASASLLLGNHDIVTLAEESRAFSRAGTAAAPALSTARGVLTRRYVQGAKAQDKAIDLEDYLEARDYAGAVTYLEFTKSSSSSLDTLQWLAYAHYHNWEHAEVQCMLQPCLHAALLSSILRFASAYDKPCS